MADNQIGNSISGFFGLAISAGAFVLVGIPFLMGCSTQSSPINADIMRIDAWSWWAGSSICRGGKTLHEAFRQDMKPGGSTTVTFPDGSTVVNFNEQNPENNSSNSKTEKIDLPQEPKVQQRNLNGASDKNNSRFKSFEDF